MTTIFSPEALKGRVALVSGASRGIGLATARALALAGATVVGTATSEKGAQAITDELKALGNEGFGLVLNVAETEGCDAAVKTVIDTFSRLDILVNNAGITRDTLVMRMKDDQFDDVLNTNLTGAFRLARAVIRPMMRQKSGRIIQIGSVVGAMGNAGQVNYAAAKAGLMGMSKSLAREVGSRGITVNTIAPGFIATDMTDALSEEQKAALLSQIPVARLGQTDDIAQAVVYLASDAGAYITGTTLHINGGMFTG